MRVILDDVQGQTGALPLLQHALYELWRARRGPWLTQAAYDENEGVSGALQRRAQATYEALTPEQQQIARNVFLATADDQRDDRRRDRHQCPGCYRGRRVVGPKQSPCHGGGRVRADGELVATLTNRLGLYGSVAFAPDAGNTSFVVRYAHGESELWGGKDRPRLLATLGQGVVEQALAPKAHRLFIRHGDGRAYLIDTHWLRAMGGDPARLSPEELESLACEGPLSSGAWDETELEPYLEGLETQACR